MSLHKLYDLSVVARTGLLWVAFMAVLWTVFAIGLSAHPEAWSSIVPFEPERGWKVFALIIVSNSLILALIALGNLFVRFGNLTPGLVILGLQAIMIGWTAGVNGFTEPFQSVAAANATFLRIGLWETSAYVLICAVTLPKSLLVSNTFPAKAWVKTTPLKDLMFTKVEVVIAVLGLVALYGAAAVEAFSLPD